MLRVRRNEANHRFEMCALTVQPDEVLDRAPEQRGWYEPFFAWAVRLGVVHGATGFAVGRDGEDVMGGSMDWYPLP